MLLLRELCVYYVDNNVYSLILKNTLLIITYLKTGSFCFMFIKYVFSLYVFIKM